MSSRDLALVAVFAALIAALGLAGTLYPFGAVVPITAQTLGVMLAGSILGWRRGGAAVAVFLVLVAVGLPLLAGGRGGLGVFASPTAGFLLGWLPGAMVIGTLAGRRLAAAAQGDRTASGAGLVARVALANLIGGIGVVYALGIPVMAWRAHFTAAKALTASAVYLPGDLIKVAVATLVTTAVVRGYPGVFDRR